MCHLSLLRLSDQHRPLMPGAYFVSNTGDIRQESQKFLKLGRYKGAVVYEIEVWAKFARQTAPAATLKCPARFCLQRCLTAGPV